MPDNCSTLSLHHLAVGYKQASTTRIVAHHITATIAPARLTCLIGENGIGKSTLLRTLAAFQPPMEGTIQVVQLPEQTATPLAQLTTAALARTIGVVLTEKPDLQDLTAFDVAGMGRTPYTGFWGRLTAADRAIVNQSLRQVGIHHLAARHVNTLSDGERQKIMIAKALAQQTPIIFLDEPTAFLDYPSKVSTLRLLRTLAHQSRKTIFLSTHDLELALQTADELWLMMRPDSPAAPTAEAAAPSVPAPEPASIVVGTPRQLADNGTLTRFISRPGITFVPETLTIRVDQ